MIIDVRIDDDFNLDPDYIPGAFRHTFKSVLDLTDRLTDKSVVVYCQKGKKISQGAVALLRTAGIKVESLEGGHFAWRDAGLPLIPAQTIPIVQSSGSTLWVTRHRPKIDRMACPWLIRRFVDSDAQFLFVAPSEVLAVAEKFEATAFDVDGVYSSHRDDRCTFDTMLEEFGLSTKPLLRLAEIIRGADTNRLDLTPESAGLLAASLGYSRMYRNDVEQIDAGMALYDAFYRWSRDAVDETHDWP
ncbi:MAG: rhodanese-related sulfurtransferase [Gammaproteobacteria bacterium]